MKKTVAGIFCMAAFCVAGYAQSKGAGEKGANLDQSFVEMAAQTDMTEAHLGQLAAEQASSQEVKDFAQTLVTDHTADYNQLTAVAAKAGLTVPKGLDAKHDKMIAPFAKLKGKAFDQRFAHEMVTGHENAIAAYDKESRDGENADVKAYAKQALPTLEKHRSSAADLAKGKGANHAKMSSGS